MEADVDDDASAPFDDEAPDPDDVDGLLSSSGGSGNMKREQSVLTRILTCESIQPELCGHLTLEKISYLI